MRRILTFLALAAVFVLAQQWDIEQVDSVG
jgi:hypothetical protein